MTWRKIPLFIWAMYSTSVIQVLATPVIAITLFLLIFERAFGIGIFDPALGGDPVLSSTSSDSTATQSCT
jgi:cytochrome c oxidase subunit 1